MNTILITYNGVDVRKDEHGYVCLNDLWYASGKQGGKTPRFWRTLVHAKEIIKHYKDTVTVENPNGSVIYAVGGAGGGTYAIREIALAYAGYLDVTLQALVYQAFLQQVDGVEPSLDMPQEFVRTFAGSSKDTRKIVAVPAECDYDISYWKGYADACKEIAFAVVKKGGRS